MPTLTLGHNNHKCMPKPQGVVTPFDALEGFERRAVRVRGPSLLGQPGEPGQQGTDPDQAVSAEDNPFTRAAAKFREIESNKHRAKLLDVSEVCA